MKKADPGRRGRALRQRGEIWPSRVASQQGVKQWVDGITAIIISVLLLPLLTSLFHLLPPPSSSKLPSHAQRRRVRLGELRDSSKHLPLYLFSLPRRPASLVDGTTQLRRQIAFPFLSSRRSLKWPAFSG